MATNNGQSNELETPATELVWLLGQPQLAEYLLFVATKVIGGELIAPAVLADEWRQANDRYYDLEQAEAGLADTIACLPAEDLLSDRISAVTGSPWFQHSFAALPASIVKVELDTLVVSQVHVEHGFRFDAAHRDGNIEAPATLFDLCLPLTPELPPVQVDRLGENRYRFASPSTDLRASPLLLLPATVHPVATGPAHTRLAIDVGFGCNFLSGIRSGSRIVLQNGHHRAYALRSMGATHAYCVVEDVTRKDELRLVGSARVGADPEFFFAARRPPLLKDYFDPALTKRLAVRQILTEIEVEVTVSSALATRR